MPRTGKADPVPRCDEDRDLMVAIVERRDRDAFAQVVKRHQTAAFNLATYLCGSRDAVEAAVQEAMLRLWTSSARFQYLGPGSVRAWLLRLVANESIRQRKRLAADRRLVARVRMIRQDREVAALDASSERNEMLDALRVKLAELTGDEREVVALYYGVGLNQDAISEHLGLSQQAISYKLKHIHEKLKDSLKKGGFAAALPLLETPDLGGVLCEGVDVPTGFCERLATISLRKSVRSVRTAALSGTPYVGIVALVLLGAGAGIAYWQTQGQTGSVESEIETRAPSLPGRTTLSMKTEVVYQDDFDGPDLDPFWEPVRPANTEDRLAYVLKDSSLLLIAGGRDVLGNAIGGEHIERKGKFRMFPRVEVVSRLVELDDRPIEICIGGTRITQPNGYKFEGLLMDEHERIVFGWKQFRSTTGEPLQVSTLLAEEPASVSGGEFAMTNMAIIVADRNGRIMVLDQSKRTRARGHMVGGIKRLKLRFKIEMDSNTEYNGFAIDSLGITRLASWPKEGSDSKSPGL